MNVNGKVAVVTGSASGLGLALCTRFAREGAHVVLSDLDQDACNRHAAPMGALPVAADVGREEGIENLVAATIEHFGRIDLFVSNAGIAIDGGIDTPTDKWHKIIGVNLLSLKRDMTTELHTEARSERGPTVEEKVERFRQLFADAPQYAKTAVENVVDELKSQVESKPPASRMQSAGRAGSRQGKVSELTLLVPLAPGGAQRLRGFLQLLDGDFDGADKVGTVHDMRFVFLDNDTKLLFATAYDGDWDIYIDDFVAKIPDYLDIISSAFEGWPGIHSPAAKDYFLKYQVTAAGWYVANPDLTVVETRKLKRIGHGLDEFLDKVGD